MINVFTLLDVCNKLFTSFDKYIDNDFRKELECFKLYHKTFGGTLFNYNYPTLIDWVDGTHQQEFIKLATKLLKQDTKLISSYKSIIQKVVLDRLKTTLIES